ncbi:MAG: hypothetical protein J3K34DRAFT_422210 [Monoraphidium minutum]|nr:MAG: hypothetical protein J3K34DRAFT_422210 [Monoraphidium minutum]
MVRAPGRELGSHAGGCNGPPGGGGALVGRMYGCHAAPLLRAESRGQPRVLRGATAAQRGARRGAFTWRAAKASTDTRDAGESRASGRAAKYRGARRGRGCCHSQWRQGAIGIGCLRGSATRGCPRGAATHGGRDTVCRARQPPGGGMPPPTGAQRGTCAMAPPACDCQRSWLPAGSRAAA